MNCKISWYCPKNSERRKIIKIAALTKYLSRKTVLFNTHMTVPHLSFYFRPALCAYELKSISITSFLLQCLTNLHPKTVLNMLEKLTKRDPEISEESWRTLRNCYCVSELRLAGGLQN